MLNYLWNKIDPVKMIISFDWNCIRYFFRKERYFPPESSHPTRGTFSPLKISFNIHVAIDSKIKTKKKRLLAINQKLQRNNNSQTHAAINNFQLISFSFSQKKKWHPIWQSWHFNLSFNFLPFHSGHFNSIWIK